MPDHPTCERHRPWERGSDENDCKRIIIMRMWRPSLAVRNILERQLSSIRRWSCLVSVQFQVHCIYTWRWRTASVAVMRASRSLAGWTTATDTHTHTLAHTDKCTRKENQFSSSTSFSLTPHRSAVARFSVLYTTRLWHRGIRRLRHRAAWRVTETELTICQLIVPAAWERESKRYTDWSPTDNGRS